MLSRIKKYTMLDYFPTSIGVENDVNPKRVFHYGRLKKSKGGIFYLITRNFREEDNFAMNLAKKYDAKLLLFFPRFEVENKNEFFMRNFNLFKKNIKLDYKIFSSKEELEFYIDNENIAKLIKDFDPITGINLPNNRFEIIEIDGNNICPIRYVSDKQDYNAAVYRKKIYCNIAEFLTSFPKTDFTLTEGYYVLEDFLQNKLNMYEEKRNNPLENITSNLSAYLNWGFVSAQRVALEVIRSDAMRMNKEAFLEELIVRRELSQNFCFYNKKFKTFDGTPLWAKNTLKEHTKDIRFELYTLTQLEKAQTSDDLWNSAQRQLIKEGKIHGYMRMYWAKQFLLWTQTPLQALKYAIYLNDKYAYDAPAASGYVGILWSIGALHDRAFQQRYIFGKVRSMTYNGAKSKFDVDKYIQKYR